MCIDIRKQFRKQVSLVSCLFVYVLHLKLCICTFVFFVICQIFIHKSCASHVCVSILIVRVQRELRMFEV